MTTTVSSGSGVWSIAAPNNVDPNDVSSTYDVSSNTITVTFDYKPQDAHTDNDAHYQHGIEFLQFTAPPATTDATGYKTNLVVVIKNELGVPMSGFELVAQSNIYASTLDKTDPHPTNYAHFHGILSKSTFGVDESLSFKAPDGSFSPGGLVGLTPAASDVLASGTIAPGATLTSMAFTLHNEELAGQDNGFTVALLLSPSQQLVPPALTGMSALQSPIGFYTPFTSVTVHDTSGKTDSAIIKVSDLNGVASDAVGGFLADPNLTHSGPGLWTLAATSPQTLSKELEALKFNPLGAPGSGGLLTITVDNGAAAKTSDTTKFVNGTPPPPPPFSILDTTTNITTSAAGDTYTGPVFGLQHQYVNITTDSLNITSSVPNSFIRSGSGMDGIDVSKANGNNVLDGSTGSNFLTGGTGNDTFYMDDRNPASPVFSTIVNFHSGDNATVFGVNATNFTMLKLDNQGAAGYTGLDLIFTAPGHVDTSFVLAGYTSVDLTNGRLSMSYGKTQDIPGLPGSEYLTVHAN